MQIAALIIAIVALTLVIAQAVFIAYAVWLSEKLDRQRQRKIRQSKKCNARVKRS